MTKQFSIIFVIVFVIGFAIGIFVGKKQCESPMDSEERLRIEIRQDSLKNANKVLKKELGLSVSLVDSLKNERNKIEIKTVYLESKRNEKIRIIDSFNGMELWRFFSNIQATDTNRRY